MTEEVSELKDRSKKKKITKTEQGGKMKQNEQKLRNLLDDIKQS